MKKATVMTCPVPFVCINMVEISGINFIGPSGIDTIYWRGYAYSVDPCCLIVNNHSNGQAVDTKYRLQTSGDRIEDQRFIDTIYRYGFRTIYRDEDVTGYSLEPAEPGGTLHDNHLHSENFVSIICNRERNE